MAIDTTPGPACLRELYSQSKKPSGFSADW